MCNPYHMAPRDHVARCFCAIAPQDKRSAALPKPDQWAAWFATTPEEAMGMLMAPPMRYFDLADARQTDELLGRS